MNTRYANRHDGEDKKDAVGRPIEKGPEEKANTELLDPEIRKDTHQTDVDEPRPKDKKIGSDSTPLEGKENGNDEAVEGIRPE